MYYNKNRRYFENKKVAFFIGLGLLAAAFILFVMPSTIDSSKIISIIVVPVLISGCILFFGSMLRRSSEAEIDEDVEKELDAGWCVCFRFLQSRSNHPTRTMDWC